VIQENVRWYEHLIQKLCNATNIADIKGHIQVISNKVHAQLFAEGVYGVLHIAWEGFELKTLFVIGTDWIGHKSNDHTIMTTTAPYLYV
jgi:hypothetical protein